MIRKLVYNFMTVSTKNNLRCFFATKTDANTEKPAQQPKPQHEPQPQAKPIQQQPIKAASQQKEGEQNQQEYVYQKQNRNTIGWWTYRFFFWGFTSLFAYNLYLVAENDGKKKVQDIPGTVPGVITVAAATYDKYREIMEFFLEPPTKKFLPDPIHPLIQPKTLVLNLSGTLVKTDFIFGKGMTIKRRPGLNQLLNKLVQKYQIIVFSNDDYNFIMNAVPYLDPRQQYIGGYFGRECLVYSQGAYIKDLKYLNREMRNIVVIDVSKDIVKKQPQNVIVLKEFDGSQDDQQLIKLTMLLDKMAGPQVRDVRKFLSNYGENPVQTYYESVKKQSQKIKEKTGSGLFGLFSGSKQAPTQAKI